MLQTEEAIVRTASTSASAIRRAPRALRRPLRLRLCPLPPSSGGGQAAAEGTVRKTHPRRFRFPVALPARRWSCCRAAWRKKNAAPFSAAARRSKGGVRPHRVAVGVPNTALNSGRQPCRLLAQETPQFETKKDAGLVGSSRAR